MTQTNQSTAVTPVNSLKPLAWLFIALGIFSVIWPTFATIALEQLIAIFFIMSGIGGLLFWRTFKTAGASMIGLVTAILTLVVGLVLAFSPMAGATTLTIILVAILLLEGGLSIWMALGWRDSNPRWVWPMASGVVTLVLALMIIAGWPSTATWAIGLLFGINLLSTGLALLALSQIGKG